jgi:hypothetical protein
VLLHQTISKKMLALVTHNYTGLIIKITRLMVNKKLILLLFRFQIISFDIFLLLNLGDPVPGIEGFQIAGDPRPGSTLTACGFPTNGTTLCNFQVCWFVIPDYDSL